MPQQNCSTTARDLELQALAPDLSEAIQGALGSQYAGLWFDNCAGRFKIGLLPGVSTSQVQAYLVARGIAEYTDFVPVRSSYTELLAAQAGLAQELLHLFRGPQLTVGVDDSENAVSIELSEALSPSEIGLVEGYANAEMVAVNVQLEPPSDFVVEPVSAKRPRTPRRRVHHGPVHRGRIRRRNARRGG
jgi:hypothetical protein